MNLERTGRAIVSLRSLVSITVQIGLLVLIISPLTGANLAA